MNGFTSFVVSFCISCVLFGFLFVLCPEGSMKLSVKYIFCICFICCVIGSSTVLQPPEISQFEKISEEEILTEQNAAVTAQLIFCETLRQQGINFRKITVDTNKLQDGSIVINKVIVYTNEEKSKILAVIGSDGYEVSVVNE